MVLFFAFHPVYRFLSTHTQEKILFKVNRDSQREKILGLLDQRNIIFYELEHNYKLNQMQIPITQRKVDILRKVSSLLAISINIGMILSYTITIKGTNPVFYVGFAEVFLLRVLSVSQLTSQIALFIIVVINRAPIILNGSGKSNVIVEEPTEHVE